MNIFLPRIEFYNTFKKSIFSDHDVYFYKR